MKRARGPVRIAVAAAAIFALALAACGDDDDDTAATAASAAPTSAGAAATAATTGGGAAPASAEATEVIRDRTFTTKEVHVTVGGKVVFDNQDGTTHTATADDGSFDTGNISGGSTKPITFDKAGSIAFHCSIHRSMTATVVVT